MNKWLKITGISFITIFALFYISFLCLPFMIDLNQYTPLLQKIVKEQINLDLEIKNPKLITTPIFEVGIKTDGLTLALPDKSPVIQTDRFKAKLSLPAIMLLTVRVSDLEFDNPKIILDTNAQATQYKLMEEIEDMLNRINRENLEKTDTEEGWFNPEWIRIKLPHIKATNYNISVNDKKSNHSLTLKGNELKVGYFHGKQLKVKTYAYLMSDDKENISLNVKLDTVLPKSKKEVLDPDDDKAEKIEIPFVNIVKIYQNYDLKAHINSKIKLRRTKNDKLKGNGSFDVDNFTLRLANYQLPMCYFHSKLNGTTANIDTKFYVTPTEKASISGKINYNKPSMDIKIDSDKVHFNNLIIFSKAILDSFGIRNDFHNLKGCGYIEANAKIKTNFKKLKSDGKIIIRDGALINNKIGLLITNTNSDLIFDENIFRIKDTKSLIGGKLLTIDGTIDNKTTTDINAKTTNMPIVGLYNAFAPSDLKKSIKMKSGDISLDAKINGKLKKSLSSIKFDLNNLGIATHDNSVNINNGNLNLTVMYDLAENILKGKLTNKNFSLLLPPTKSTITDNYITIDFNNDFVKINETDILINNNSQIKILGALSDYQKSPIIDIRGNGTLLADDLRKFAGADAKPYIDARGKLPIVFTLAGDDKRQHFMAKIISNAGNYITPVHFDELKSQECITQVEFDYKGDRLNINKTTGLFTANHSAGETAQVILNPVITAHGTLAKLDTIEPRFNMFRIDIKPNRLNFINTDGSNLHGRIFALKNSGFDLNGHIVATGKLEKPFLSGGINIENLNLPSLLVKSQKLGIQMSGYSMKLFADNIDLNGSDMKLEAQSDFVFSPVTKLHKLEVLSNNFDVDKVMKVSELAAKTLPQQPKTSPSNASADIPLAVSGRFLFRNIKTGNIKLTNTRGKLLLARNIVTIHPFMTNCFKGVVRGKIATNLINGELDMDIKGHNLDVEQALADAANTKDAISGTASFNMKATMSGSTYEEQMKSLKGNVNFRVANGGFGPIGKIENLILAENIRNSQFFQTALGGIINNIATIDTAHFTELKGLIKFNNGKAILAPLTSQGNVMSLHIAGDYDLLKNEADMKVRGRLGSFLSNMLGPIAMLNPVNLVKATPGINVVMAKAFTLFTVVVTPEEMNAIPNFAKTTTPDNTATKFQIVLRGDATKPLSMIKSFKWLSLQSDMDKAEDFAENMPEEYLLADPETPEAKAAAEAKAKEDAKIINRIKRKLSTKKM